MLEKYGHGVPQSVSRADTLIDWLIDWSILIE